MAQSIIGRKKEQEIFKDCLDSGKAEFVAVYGRRRIGKTFLVRQYFSEKFDFYATGIFEGTKQEQLGRFCHQLSQYSGNYYAPVSNWMDAFELLQGYLKALKKKHIVIFLDELPWFDTPKSRFLKAFEYFWNSWASAQDNLKMIVCGSATTWMTGKLIGDKGGLHNRITRRIHLQPFTLGETESYLHSQGIDLSRHQTVEAYMIMGGVPYYLSLMKRGKSLPQLIDELFFSKTAELREEYNFLFRSLFKDSHIYHQVVELLATKSKGMTRNEIIQGINTADNGYMTEILKNLEACDFIRKYYPFGNKERNMLFQLTDLYTLFYLRYVKKFNGRDSHFWSNRIQSGQHNAWSGYAFEQVCLTHIDSIKQALGISGVATDVCSWVSKEAQIDLLLDRRDQVINLCEIKYALTPFEITKDYAMRLQERREHFRQQTETRKAVHLTMITTYGVKHNAYWNDIQSEITMDDLFG